MPIHQVLQEFFFLVKCWSKFIVEVSNIHKFKALKKQCLEFFLSNTKIEF